jgi:hypothetical protein
VFFLAVRAEKLKKQEKTQTFLSRTEKPGFGKGKRCLCVKMAFQRSKKGG